jgi:hypothetical protein
MALPMGGGMNKQSRAALGFRAHSGWAAVVAIGGSVKVPVVLDRSRIEIADPDMPESVQPYHAAADLPKAAAAKFIRDCAAVTNAMAKRAVRKIVKELAANGNAVVACGNLLGSGHPPATLAQALASHPMLHTAEGEFFRAALDGAIRSAGLEPVGIREKHALELGSEVLGMSAAQLQRTLNDMGKTIGPPWRQDEKLATLAAWLALAQRRTRTAVRSR